jgi:hypothetical protein
LGGAICGASFRVGISICARAGIGAAQESTTATSAALVIEIVDGTW